MQLTRRQFIKAAAAVPFAYYLPMVSTSTKRGIGLADLHVHYQDVNALCCSWFYDWSIRPIDLPGYIPLSETGKDPGLQFDWLLLFNEPDNYTQTFVDPQTAAYRYSILAEKYDNSRLVVGGLNSAIQLRGGSWLPDFLEEVQRLETPVPLYWHLHGYVELGLTVADIINWWTVCHDLTGGNYWISEFGDPSGNLDSYRLFLAWLDHTPWVTRYAAFANRLTGYEYYYPNHWPKPARMHLIDDSGRLTDLGRLYCG